MPAIIKVSDAKAHLGTNSSQAFYDGVWMKCIIDAISMTPVAQRLGHDLYSAMNK